MLSRVWALKQEDYPGLSGWEQYNLREHSLVGVRDKTGKEGKEC